MPTLRPLDDDPSEAGRLRRAAASDPAAWDELLSGQRARLRRMVVLRLDHRLQGRIDPSDVLQEACLEAARTLPTYLERPGLPFFLWLRWLTGMSLQLIHRNHLGVQARDAGREVRIDGGPIPEASSAALAAQLLGRDARASSIAIRAERKLRLQDALNGTDSIDREVLVLRHFEQLTNGECARVLEITSNTATRRYLRAVKRLRDILTSLPGGSMEEWR